MFWKKKTNNLYLPHPKRCCDLLISEKYKQILFVAYGKASIGLHVELDEVISDTWPCNFGQLQINIEETLKRYGSSREPQELKGRWPSYEASKAKTQRSFETDYLRLELSTDTSKTYGIHEKERVTVIAQPDRLINTYHLSGTGHLLDTRVAQIVVDIFDAGMKIRNR